MNHDFQTNQRIRRKRDGACGFVQFKEDVGGEAVTARTLYTILLDDGKPVTNVDALELDPVASPEGERCFLGMLSTIGEHPQNLSYVVATFKGDRGNSFSLDKFKLKKGESYHFRSKSLERTAEYRVCDIEIEAVLSELGAGNSQYRYVFKITRDLT